VEWVEISLRLHTTSLTAALSIINERKTHSNFQLVIITHDENFLRKLGQSDVMEYYWFASL
jgi:DNA repair exonuclease SbcCD ATPase subunit